MILKAPNDKPGPDSPDEIAEECSQAVARLGVCVFALLYVAGWSLFHQPVGELIVWALLAYTAFSAVWIPMLRRHPGHVPWRRILVIFTDLGINTFFMHVLQAKGAFFYPMYLWIIVGNGMRFGPRYLMLAMIVGATYFGSMLAWSDYWKANLVAGIGLLFGLVILPVFYLTLLRRLHDSRARLAAEVEKSQAAARAKSEFLANMSHELRTPMSGVIGVAELLRMTPLDDSQSRYLDLIHHSAVSLLTVIDDILELSRIEADKVVIRSRPFDLRAVVSEVCDLLRPSAAEKDLELRVSLPENLTPSLSGDPTRVRQVLFNLLGNAVKFTDRGHVSLEVREETRTDSRSEVCFTVSDSGIGIPAEKLETIFEHFEQAETRYGRRFGGSGLGLAISRRLARRMGGDITVSSRPGVGTTFEFTLILERGEDSPARIDSGTRTGNVSGQDPGPGYGLRALVVEDNPVNRLILEKYLDEMGIVVTTTEDGEQALDQLREKDFDLVFMDVQLPVLDGLETTRRIRAAEPAAQHLPIIALTANVMREDREACTAAGMDLFVRKPMQLEDVRSAVETLQHRGMISPPRN